MIRRRLGPRTFPHAFLFSCTVLLISEPVLISAAVVTLNSIEIFKIHDWIPSEPTIFFRCRGENKTVLPDVKEKNVAYAFKGVESWQPMTELPGIKCKRCGLYEKNVLIPEEEFDEWELCASDFISLDGRYIHFKDEGFNATFLCPECPHIAKDAMDAASNERTASDHSSQAEDSSDEMPWHVIVVVCALALGVFLLGLIASYKWWQRRKRKQQQARFLKLFEEADDIDEELDTGPLSHVL